MKIAKILLVGALSASSLMAHSLWLNSFESFSKKGGHAIVGLGWGHDISIDDSVPTQMDFESFDLTDPKNNKIALKKPLSKVDEIYKDAKLVITDNNMAMQKVAFSEDSLSGTYSVSLKRKAGYFTKYIDKKGKNRFKRAPQDKIKDVKEILSSTKNTTYAKTYFVFKEWSQPIPVGHELEIIPTTDISKLKIGDTINLEVLYKGKPLEKGSVIAKNSLNKTGNALYSKIRKGNSKFQLTNSGQWIFEITHKLEGKVDLVNTASATITVK